MGMIYAADQRRLQDEHGTRRLADRLAELAHPVFAPPERAFIEAASMFFLSTVDAAGQPTVSYKGGAPGFVRFTGEDEFIFPNYDGNGMFLSLGNVAATARVGLLFIDFAHPHRLRVHGTARLADTDLASYPGADCVVQVKAEQIFVNCGRYIHAADGSALSPHLPDAAGQQPFPAWKRIDVFEGALPDGDEARVQAAGGTVTLDNYAGEGGPATIATR